ncbi:hypothetical protein [Streptomyces sp. AM6-12]|uniref:hypothetical protein n=1 Tax=Streptomyces sp. AM6-12 TaxID=3345149 RepID=UPI0037A744C2
MNTRAVNAAAGVVQAALEQGRTAAGVALALESAQLLQSPEHAAELERLRLEAAGLRSQLALFNEWRAADGARIAELLAERHKTNEALADVTVALRGAHEETDPGACQGCGSLPEQWCPDCAACEKGCFGGFDGNECTHGNAPWRRPSTAESADRLTRLLAPTQALLEDPHDSPLHHGYRLGRDLPQMGGAS